MAQNGFIKNRHAFKTIRDKCLAERSLYVDPDFPPEESSLYVNIRERREYGNVIWKRPRDIVRNPMFIVDDVSRHDLDQGQIGNCWFVAAAAVVCTSHKNLLKRIVPLDQYFDRNYAGVFRFNFWWYGEWVEVVVDDYLPTNGRHLIFCYNREHRNEFWCALLEKAYAKLRGGYTGLEGGKIQDALVDFSGGIGEVIDIENKNNIPRNLFHLLHKSIAMNSMVGVSIHRPPHAIQSEVELPNGLFSGHAYSITGIKEVPTGSKSAHLLRLRNPWGKGEWTGSWSDRSIEMRTLSPQIRNDLQVSVSNDGEFWMLYGDLVDNFDEIEMCHLQPDALTEEISQDENTSSWNVTMFHDAWKHGLTAGGCGNAPHQALYWRNPQFFVTLENKDEDDREGECTMIVSLTEKEKNNQVKIAIGFDVYRLKYPEMKPLDGERAARNSMRLAERSGQYKFYREVTKRFEFKPGVYVIIPSTFNINEEANFLLRIFTEKTAESGVLDVEEPTPISPVPIPISPVPKPITPVTPISPKFDGLMEVFLQYTGSDKRLDYRELRSFILLASYKELGEQIKFSEEACRSLVSSMDRNRSGYLDLEETRKMWKDITAYRDVFMQFDRNKSGAIDGYELEAMFGKLGFPTDRNLIKCILRRYGGRHSTLSLDAFIIVICKLVLMFGIFQEHRDKSGSGGPDGVAQFTRNEFLQYTMFC